MYTVSLQSGYEYSIESNSSYNDLIRSWYVCLNAMLKGLSLKLKLAK